MKYSSTNTFWAHVIAQELSRSDTGPVCLTPGSRNTPLTVSTTRNEALEVLSHLDERSSSFFSLGTGRRSGRPGVLVCTSGTATAEFHPAVLEAYHDRIPMLILTADRPPELQQSGANQTVDQHELYRNATRWSRTLPEPEITDRKIRSLRTTINRAVHRTRLPTPGPVHLNVPFRKPLEPDQDTDETIEEFAREHPLAEGGRSGSPFTRFRTTAATPLDEDVEQVQSLLDESDRPLIYAGPVPAHRRDSLNSVRELTRSASIPFLADPLSGQRYGASDRDWDPLTEYEFSLPLLPDSTIQEPDLFLRIGHPPNASNRLMGYLAETTARQVLISRNHDYPDAQFRVSHALKLDPGGLFEDLDTTTTTFDRTWIETLLGMDRELRKTRLEVEEMKPDVFEGDILRVVLDSLSPSDNLLVGNSTPVRDLIQYGGLPDKRLSVSANRGTSGIDGQLSTAAGLGYSRDGQAVAVVGDVGFYHDLTGLLAFRRHDVNGVIVVINNDGGGIFQRLPIKNFDPPFTNYVKTPHGLTFESAAEQFEAAYENCTNLNDLKTELDTALKTDRLTVLEVSTDAETNEKYRDRVKSEIKEKFEGLSS